VRPIEQLTGTSEFNEVFFSDARTDADLVVGEPGQGWQVAMALLGFERGVSTIGQQVGFERELAEVVELAKSNGSYDDPVIFDRLAEATVGLEVMRANAVRTLVENLSKRHQERGQDNIAKLVWADWHKSLGQLAMDILGPEGLSAESAPNDLTAWQRLFLFTRADTIYGGSNEIQRNILAERVLGLPKEPKGAAK
jgi:alkylation response protein AidB-like acyl-CoA dehydrogenase